MIYLPVYQKTAEITIPEKIQELLFGTECDIIVTFSGGKDSIAQVLYLLELGIDKKRMILHHHDVDGHGRNLFDWACTPSYCKDFAEAFGLPLVFSWRKGGIEREIRRTNEGLQDIVYSTSDGLDVTRLLSKQGNSTRNKFPAVAADLRTRWCSSVAKIDVLSRVVNDLYDNCDLLVLTGERREESASRAKYKDHEKYRSWSKRRNAWQWRPVIDFTEAMVWKLFEKYKVQPHPCYELGWNRCSCQTCIFGSANVWASVWELSPEKIWAIGELEQEYGHTLYRDCDIFQKVDRGISFLDPAKVSRWKNEALGEFVSPIFVDEWSLPAGAFGEEKSGSV